MRIALCSDEQGGEHDCIDLPENELKRLTVGGFIHCIFGPDHYDDGVSTYQAPVAVIHDLCSVFPMVEIDGTAIGGAR